MNDNSTSRPPETVVHYYAGWPGKTLCEAVATLPIQPISSIRYEHVTCERCKEMLQTAERTSLALEQDQILRNRVESSEIRVRQLRDVMARWNAEARSLGYDGVADLLAALRPPTSGAQQ